MTGKDDVSSSNVGALYKRATTLNSIMDKKAEEAALCEKIQCCYYRTIDLQSKERKRNPKAATEEVVEAIARLNSNMKNLISDEILTHEASQRIKSATDSRILDDSHSSDFLRFYEAKKDFISTINNTKG